MDKTIVVIEIKNPQETLTALEGFISWGAIGYIDHGDDEAGYDRDLPLVTAVADKIKEQL